MSDAARRLDAKHQPPALAKFLKAEDPRDRLVKQGQAYIAALAEWLKANHADMRPLRAVQRFAKAHDLLLDAAYHHCADAWRAAKDAPPPPVAIAALGGYGRRELYLKSDIDVMILMGEAAPGAPQAEMDEFVKSLLYVLIDMRLDLGYATRSTADCLKLVGTDLESATALIESHLITGSRALYKTCRDAIHAAMMARGARWFLKGHYAAWIARREKYESTVYLMEPNLKEGQGGLRDAQCVRWGLYALTGSTDLGGLVKQAGFSEAELRRYREAIAELIRIRNQIHITGEGKGDQLSFQLQPVIAERLGYEGAEGRLPEENFMQSFYRHARVVDRLSTRAMSAFVTRDRGRLSDLFGRIARRKIDKNLVARGSALFLAEGREGWLAEDIHAVLKLFQKAAHEGCRVSERTLDQIARALPAHAQSESGNAFAQDAENQKRFMSMLKMPGEVAQTLAGMHACGALSAIVPEFARVESMVRIDYYHHYTVDEHTLKTIEMAEALMREPRATASFEAKVAREIKRWDLLNLALLLHDVGKGYGGGHALRGGAIAQRVCERFGLPEADMDCVRFLVLSHLKLSHAAQRRDLTDPRVARQLAEECGTLERLKMLYVLTVCDLRGVSPTAWTEWKGQLFRDCYLHTRDVFDGTEDSRARRRQPVDHMEKRIMERIEADPAMRAALKKSGAGADEIRRFVVDAPGRYLAHADPGLMADHFIMRLSLTEERPVAWHWFHAPGKDCTDLSVCALDVPGMFSYLCGALATKQINIWSAQIFSTTDGYAINRFELTDLENKPLAEDLVFDRLLDDLNDVLSGKKTFEELVKRHGGRRRRGGFVPRSPRAPQVNFDNEGSQEFTLLEVRMRDRPGVLYQIAAVLRDHSINIHRAMISTEAYGLFDTFYVTDLDYNKIHDKSAQEKIRAALLAAVDRDLE